MGDRLIEMDPMKNTRRTMLACVLLGAITLAAYWPVIHNDFVSYDDREYVTENPHVLAGLTWDTASWAFRTGHAGNWHPLTWLSHIVDVQLYGLKAGGHHLTSLLLHAANAVLLLLLLRRLTGAFWRSVCVAALFALHPLHVESVAWVAERKDVLSGFFFLLTLWAYARYAGVQSPTAEGRTGAGSPGLAGSDVLFPLTPALSPGEREYHRQPIRESATPENVNALPSGLPFPGGEGRGEGEQGAHPPGGAAFANGSRNPRSALWYLLALVLFALGLMSKPMLVTLPGVLLLLDFWPLRRLQRTTMWSLIGEKIPFLALSVTSSVVTFLIQQGAGAVSSLEALPLEFRIANALISYVRYATKMIWPANLAAFYPAPAEWPLMWVSGAALVLGGLSVLALYRARKAPYLAFGWLWYLGMLVPVIGIVQVGQQAMADRYSYLPLIGLFVAIVWSAAEIPARWPATASWLAVCAAALMAACAGLTWNQTVYWRNSASLFEHALAVTRDNAVAHNNLGVSLLDAGNMTAAEGHFAEAVRLKPHYPEGLANLGFCREKQGRPEEAGELFRRSLEVRPTPAGHYNLANLLAKEGKIEEADAHYQAALQLKPEFVEAWYNLGILEAKRGKPEAAEQDYATVLRIKPDHTEAHLSLGAWLAGQKRFDEAIVHFKAALRAAPDNADAHFNLAAALNAKGDFARAATQFEEVCRLHPEDVEARENLALALLYDGKMPDAARQFREVLRVRPDARTHYYLGLALDGTGQAEEAVAHYREAARLGPNTPLYLNDLAWFLATNAKAELRNGAEAVRLAEQACRLSGGKEARLWGTLDAAYAETGRFAEAVATAAKAREMALAAGQPDIAQRAEERLALYRAGNPYRTAAPPQSAP
jgi:tetratricopeptide (TPR) repeat protein